MYRATDTRLHRDVALKVLLPAVACDPDLVARFSREARVLASLNHTNIAQIFGLEESHGVHAIVMELVDGPTLADRIARGAVPLAEALGTARQIADALEAAHQQGIVHRDLKPANVAMRPDGTVKVLDFGLAKLVEREMVESGSRTGVFADSSSVTSPGETGVGMLIGTVAYMSPEQASARSADKRSDVWAFGCVLFEMLTGRPAFAGERRSDVLARIVEDEPDWTTLPAKTPASIRKLLKRCLEKDPKRRLDSAAVARIEIDDALAGPGPDVTARTPGGRALTLRWVISIALAVLLVAVVLGVGLNRARDPLPASLTSEPIRSLAVLPLSNLSGDEAQEYFADGMTEALITELARIGALRVISRTSIMQYKNARKPLPQIARELGVEGIVEGTVVRDGNRVRITAQLIRAASERNLWGESYERDLVEVLSLQRQVARAIANQVRVTLTPEEERTLLTDRAVAPAAQEAYLRGLHLFNTGLITMDAVGFGLLEPLRQSISAFEDATGLDPSWAQAWAALARSRHWVASFGNPQLYPAAKTAALRAIELDDSTSDAHGALAFILQRYEWDWADAEREFKRAIELNPNIGSNGHGGYGIMLSILGRHDEALAMFAQAEELDPLVLVLQVHAAQAAVRARRYDDAFERSRRALEANPRAGWAYSIMGQAYRGQGRNEDALAAFQRYQDLSPGTVATSAVACGLALTGRRAEAMRLVSSIGLQDQTAGRPKSGWLDRARGYACLGDARTFDMLELALAMRVEALPTINVDSSFDAVRPDPRFQAVLRKMNLPSALD